MPPIEIVVDGTDSGGKTPCVEALCRAFAPDRDVHSCAPFRVQEVYHLWEREPRRAAAIIRSIMDDFRQASATADLILWDRGWPTVFVSTTDSAARTALLPFPELTVLLLNSMETTRRQAQKHGLQALWLDDPALVRRYHDAYHALPGEVSERSVAAFLPAADGRYDYAAICAYARGALERDPP
jgi:hypothetical protein